MMTACIRCQGRATTLLTYHHADATAYLDDALGHEQMYEGILLCENHAERFSAPRGWTTFDRRSIAGAAPIGRAERQPCR